jgi:hypothetical protein
MDKKCSIFSQVFMAMAQMLELNENNKETWGTAHIQDTQQSTAYMKYLQLIGLHWLTMV